MGNYDDIINLPHKQSVTRPHMSRLNRAAQFSPYAALVGFEKVIAEAARTTEQKIELSDDSQQIINERLRYVVEHLTEQPQISITYFQPDGKKSGGAYVKVTGTVEKIDQRRRLIIMQDMTTIPIDEIVALSV